MIKDSLPKIGISSCLLGENVRYDGVSKRDENIISTLSDVCTLVPICPEVEMGMSVPREKIQLFIVNNIIRVVGIASGIDWTEKMIHYAEQRIQANDFKELSGFILKSKSPSCGFSSTELFDSSGLLSKEGTGLFARCLIDTYPKLPIEDERNLLVKKNRDIFIQLVKAYQQSK